jgi:beta-glucosidase
MPNLSRRVLFSAVCLALLASLGLPMEAQQQVDTKSLPYMNPALPIDQRVKDLIGRMTLEEKVQQMRDHAPAIPRLGVPKYDWWNEGLHGVAFAGYATNFPQVIGMAATFDTNMVHTMGQTISTEARAKYDEAIRNGQHEQFFGLTFWAPNINIFRDPRWGRGQETYGEDPFLTGRMAVAFVSGMQGNDPKYFRVVSTPKHYAVHSGPEPLRHGFNVDASPHDLEDTYLPAFRAAVTEANAQSVMCAYNATDGVPDCANKMLLQQHLRDDWHFSGYVVSDCAAVADIDTGHHYAPDFAHAAADAVKAGTDLECGYGPGQAFPALVQAVKENLVTEADIDQALTRLYRARFKLGMFDPPASFEYGHIPFSVVNSPQHRQLSLKAARETMVLLKNDGTLPLKAGIKSIAVVGPTAELVQSLQGNYNGPPPNPVYPVNGIEKRFSSAKINYAQGSTLVAGMAMPIEHTALHPESGSGYGLTGEYFSSKDLSGKPVLTRTDRNVNFNWDKVVPVAGLQRNNYSVRWSGKFVPPAAGDYKLGVRVNYCYACENAEGFKLYLDNKLIVSSSANEKTPERGTVIDSAVHFDNTEPHAIRLEYFHGTGSAGIDLTWEAPADALREQAVQAAKESDVVIATVGLAPTLEGEEMPVKLAGFSGGDRTSIDLPAAQEDLLKAVAATGKPLIVVLQNGSALAVNWAQEHANAILEAWYPGEEGGTAIAETLAGDNNPAGRLPLTFYSSLDQVPPFTDYSMAKRTYRYFEGKPLYGFGYGLSYTTFGYSKVKVPQQIKAGQPLTVTGEVKNTGSRAGDEVVELYLTQPKGFETPRHELAAFKRIHLKPGETQRVTLTVEPRSIGQVNEKGDRVVMPGEYTVYLGGSQPGDGASVQEAKFTVTGSETLPK